MKTKIIIFLRHIFPFLLTLGLWRLSDSFWNPAGILAIIPIFYCSFVRSIDWFPLFSIFMCIALDYNFETVCYWLAIYCLFYSINSFQNIIDITSMEKNGIYAFMFFIGLSILIQVCTNFTITNIISGFLIFIWCSILYIPTTVLIQRIQE